MSEEKQTFDRGSALSIFGSDRREDTMALVFALILAFAVYLAY
jgi:hypothetical protein